MQRGCGTRSPGGLYACCGASPGGKPVEHFLVDPPIPLDTKPFRAPQLFERDGLTHMLIWVGAKYYPYVPDFVEEAKGQGVSRRIPSNFPIEKLSQGSCMYLCHPKAVLPDPCHQRVRIAFEEGKVAWSCPKGYVQHHSPEDVAACEVCLGLLWPLASLEPGTTKFRGIPSRQVGDTHYELPELSSMIRLDKHQVDYATGLFAVFPITDLDYIMDERKQVPKELAEKASKTNVPLRAVEE